MSEKEPDRLYIERDDRATCYDVLSRERILKDRKNRELFMMAMMIGLSKGSRLPLKKREGFFLAKELDDQQQYIIKAVAVQEKEGELEILKDMREVYKIAEEYANGGIHILKDTVVGEEPGTVATKLESILFSAYKGIPRPE
jgi:hypothetical protein